MRRREDPNGWEEPGTEGRVRRRVPLPRPRPDREPSDYEEMLAEERASGTGYPDEHAQRRAEIAYEAELGRHCP